MTVELGSLTLERLTSVEVRERTRIARHAVPGMSGDLSQVLGRPSVEVEFEGIFYGDAASDELKALRDSYTAHDPVDFFTEAVGEGYFTQVLISRLEVSQRAGFPDQFDFRCSVLEYVEPPEPAAASPFGDLDAGLMDEAAGFMDDVQNALEEVSQLTDLIANAPSFGDPTSRLPSMVTEYSSAVDAGMGVLNAIRAIF